MQITPLRRAYLDTPLLRCASILATRSTRCKAQGLKPGEKSVSLLFYHHINPYGVFELDMRQCIPIKEVYPT